MKGSAKFIVKRKDVETHLDGARLASECLLVGSHAGSDLLLDDPDIHSTHVGIVCLDKQYWLYEVKPGPRIVMHNHRSVGSPVLLKSGDELLMGPYRLEVSEDEGPLSITVKAALEAAAVTPPGEVILQSAGARNSARDFKSPDASTSNILNALVDKKLEKIHSQSPFEPQDLDAFMEKHQERLPKELKAALSENARAKQQFSRLSGGARRDCVAWLEEAGEPQRAARVKFVVELLAAGLKLDEKTRAQFDGQSAAEPKPAHAARKKKLPADSWRPTFDLREYRRKAFYVVGAAVVVVLVVAGQLIDPTWNSPGPVAHASLAMEPAGLEKRNIAQLPSPSACATCHTGAAVKECAACHTTADLRDAATGELRRKGFRPTVYDAHRREGIDCKTCHTEHSKGSLLSYRVCADCHNGAYRIKAGERAGRPLAVPHGGSVGYPVEKRQWRWPGLSAERWLQKDLPAFVAAYSRRDQFHVLHRSRFRCVDCHTAGVNNDEGLRQSPRAECVKCHAVTFTAAGVKQVKANCNTCHQQHGQSQDMARLVPADERTEPNIKQYIARLTAAPPDDTGSVVAQDDGPSEPEPALAAGRPTAGFWLRLLTVAGLLVIAGLTSLAAWAFSRGRPRYKRAVPESVA